MKSIHTQTPERQGLPKGKLLRVCCVLACALVNPYALTASALTPEETQTEVQQDTKQTQRRISGRIVDDTGEGLPGVAIAFKESSLVGITDSDGYFDIPLTDKEKTMVVTFVGMKPQQVSIGSKRKLNLTMESDQHSLSDVIVTGYQTLSKERATGAFALITPEKLKGKLQTNIMQRLEGAAAGLTVMGTNDFFVRGITTLRNGASGYEPLIVVDGMPFEGSLASINPATIRSVTLLKDAAAASIYGARAANGVIVITTISGNGAGKVNVRYDSSVKFTPKPNMDYLNLMDSRELVDFQKWSFKYVQGTYGDLNKREEHNPLWVALLKHRAGMMDDAQLEKELDVYRNLDNRDQLDRFYRRTGVEHQHNLSVTGGNEYNTYALTLNYGAVYPNAKYVSTTNYGFTLRDEMKFFKWLKADLSLAANFTRGQGDSGAGSYDGSLLGMPSYYMLEDAEGRPLHIRHKKSEYEMQRLMSIGLHDEHYSPITNREEEFFENKSSYYRMQLGFNVMFTPWLNLDVRYQTENGYYRDRYVATKYSYKMRHYINDAAQYDPVKQELTLNIPEGGMLTEKRGDKPSYTLRAQLNFVKETGKHYITAIAGAERRQNRETETSVNYVGYDDQTLGYKPINVLNLLNLQGTQALYGYFTEWGPLDNNYVSEHDNRFVAFYANASYAFDDRYDLTGSIRIDQSNLFGTDPKYQYRPLWSLGASWHLRNEHFMEGRASWLNNLTMRLTYGIGGNIPKGGGPFLTISDAQYSDWAKDFFAQIKNPPNKSLRWEKTATFNFGIDFAILGNRIWGSLDFYNKNTTDLLAFRTSDYTLGWDNVLLNYGSMYNRGVELSLGSTNVATPNFKWDTSLNFSYNKNKLVDVEDSETTVFGYTKEYANVKGYPVGGVFSFKYAGINDAGRPQFYVNQGQDVDQNVTDINDLEFSGTSTPVYTGSLTNSLSYRNFDLSFMFVYYGGHVFRGEAAQYLMYPTGSNIAREVLNLWKQPGDEKNPDVTPGIVGGQLDMADDQHPWYAADKHVQKGDYIKLRDVSLTYNFSKQLISRVGLSSLSVTLQAQNLFTWHANNKGFDPEAMSTYGYTWGKRSTPIPTTWTLGISANF